MSYLTNEEKETNAIGFFDESAAFTEVLDACWGFGPLEVCAKLASIDKVDISIKLAGVKIGSGSLTASDNRLCAGANVGLVKAKLCVLVSFPEREVRVEGELCVPNIPSGWSCRRFNSKILSW